MIITPHKLIVFHPLPTLSDNTNCLRVFQVEHHAVI